MYVNERDQINYHGFLRALREMNGVSQETVSKGICTVSGMNRFENGNRIAEKLMRDRLTARLGISGEKYEDYLQPKEYVRWQQRLEIVKAIEKRDLNRAKNILASYEVLPGLNCVNKQFVATMCFMILSLEDASCAILLDCIRKAVKCTVPNVSKALAGEQLLSDQEINLIAELMRLMPAEEALKDARRWRISEFEKLISYMETSCWEKLQKAKVYPKVVFYICQLLLEGDINEEECRRGLTLCYNAMELLRDTSRLYYFIEITETRRKLAECMLHCNVESSEKIELEEMLTENNSYEKVFKELYAEYEVPPYMSDFCYLYYETECHDMAEVIEIRRNMLGLSRIKLAEGICSDKTIIRFEREGRNPSVEVVRLLFEKMGLCAEYRRARVVTNNVDALMLWNEVVRNMNNYDFKNWKVNLEMLEKSLHMGISHNRQEISRLNGMLRHRSKQIGDDEFYQSCKNALEYTLPMEALEKDCKKHFSRNELNNLFDFAFETKGDISEKCLNVLYEKYGKIRRSDGVDASQLCVYEYITASLESFLGNYERYEESNEISRIMLKECLFHRRMGVIADNLYNLIWNYQQTESSEFINVRFINKQLNKCWILSKVNKKSYREAFFRDKMIELN